QVVFLARIFEERGAFSFEDVAGAIADKLVRRHPHVFADLQEDDPEALHKNWDRIKAGEKSDRPQTTPLISAPPKTLPALQRAQKLLTKMDRYRLAPDIAGKAASTDGPLAQAPDTLSRATNAEAENKLGQMLLATVDLARRRGVDAEGALRRSTDRLAHKTSRLEEALRQTGRSLADVPEEELRELWFRIREDEDR
nr:hypothetical protein [Desulfuromonadales bacterium]NIR33268.1 hypothetical protein [Desulfuromonadales bacterium]NIS42053.1 hypothetical protein [Desulfuromonadales bacterium]